MLTSAQQNVVGDRIITYTFCPVSSPGSLLELSKNSIEMKITPRFRVGENEMSSDSTD